MTERLVYLAGPITGFSYDLVTDWRNQASAQFADNIIGLSPMRAKDYLRTVGEIADTYEDFALSTQTATMARDSFDVRRCDLLLVNLLGAGKVSIGTMLEIGMAYALNKPVVLVIEKEDNPHDHGMVREACGWRVETLYGGIHIVNAILAGG